ncbi:hypothetical protein PILCRDRAFT_90830 [Piloderma croceum F 1598]|uniref:Uncharacterized protein n=1 Tax=Piloderma croceum (strain F 1598) TaxID=765440 RepID=A0A0C3BLB7_PILCF|nr:hypothetical protein PILCRDRAFT_90830 [Piloderma croceum F 1598]
MAYYPPDHHHGSPPAIAMPTASPTLSDTQPSVSVSSVAPHADRERKVSGRASTHLKTSGLSVGRLGSRSPNSIPSSPTSIHSSSSAIFERDIEPITCPSPPHFHHPPNPHRTPRSKATEQLDQSVPSVLDSAATILASSANTLEDDRISVVAPAPSSAIFGGLGTRSGVASPIGTGSYRSRSPSPTMGNVAKRTSLLLNIPLQTNLPPATIIPQTISPSGMTKAALPVHTHPNVSTPSIVTPTSAYYSVAESSEGSGPTTTIVEHPPSSFPAPSRSQPHSPAAFSTVPLNLSHPPSPIASSSAGGLASSNADKRLSFMAYSDLLASTPASLQPLTSLTTSASSEPPPHIPSVSGMTQASASAQQAQIHSQMHSPSHSPMSGSSLMRAAGVIEGRGLGVGDRDSVGIFDDVGGEWEREGMGGGLEERLEALLAADAGLNGLTTPVR